MNVGDCGLIVEGTVNPPPGSGSGNPLTPCARMHSACLSCDVMDRLGLTRARSASGRLHDRWAERNAGDRLSTLPTLGGAPFAAGSGKAGTPWDRMHAANSSPAATAVERAARSA